MGLDISWTTNSTSNTFMQLDKLCNGNPPKMLLSAE